MIAWLLPRRQPARAPRERPAPGSREERRLERNDRLWALLVAAAVHGAALAFGNRSTDAEPLRDGPGAGPAGPQAVVALDADTAQRLLARLGPPAPLLERDGASLESAPTPWSDRSDPLALPEAPPLEVAPAAPPAAWRPPAATGPLALESPPESPRAAEQPPAAPPAERARVPLPPAPTLEPEPASATPSGASGEQSAGPAGQSGDDAPLVDASVLDGLILFRPMPLFPASARHLRGRRTVELRIHVGLDGSVTTATLERASGHGALDASALAAVRRWQFDAKRMAQLGVGPRFRMHVHFEAP